MDRVEQQGNKIREGLRSGQFLFDGSMGSLLMERNITCPGDPCLLNILQPQSLEEIHQQYADAGADVMTTNTFGANRFKLADSAYTVDEVVVAGVSCAKKTGKLVALDIGPLGQLMRPMGELDFDTAYEAFSEMARAGAAAGADLVLIETMSDILEAKAAVLAVKENSDLPVVCTMTFQHDGRTLSGNSPEVVVRVLEGLGVDGLGVNCSLGPKGLVPIVEEIVRHASVPVLVQPNAGLPQYQDGTSVYLLGAHAYGQELEEVVQCGVSMIGGCCGTTPEHIETISKKLRKQLVPPTEKTQSPTVCSATAVVRFDQGPVVIGERINPTGKKALRTTLQAGDIGYAVKEAWKQRKAGAQIIDVNVSARNVDEKDIYERLITELNGSLDVPLQIDNTTPEIVERALRLYAGVPVLNSVNAKKSALDALLPIAAKYGAVIIALCIDENGLPETVQDRVDMASTIVQEAKVYGIAPQRILVDCLTLSAASNRDGTEKAFVAMGRVKEELGTWTTLGASNVSYGMPARDILNGVYLSMAFARGLDAPITDPTVPGLQQVIDSYRFLIDREVKGQSYVERYANVEGSKPQPEGELDLKQAVIEGLKDDAALLTGKLLESNKPDDVIEGWLIPALNTVGDRYEQGDIYLPQLLGAAEAVKAAFEMIRQQYAKTGETSTSKGTIIMATVEGDVHDIGKNIVKVLLENYGYHIIDLGKDVPPLTVLQAVQKHDVKLVGLSALMTTTVPAMEATIKLLQKECPQVQVMVGGAVLTQNYAKEIGADFYGKDARQSVQIADRVFGELRADAQAQ